MASQKSTGPESGPSLAVPAVALLALALLSWLGFQLLSSRPDSAGSEDQLPPNALVSTPAETASEPEIEQEPAKPLVEPAQPAEEDVTAAQPQDVSGDDLPGPRRPENGVPTEIAGLVTDERGNPLAGMTVEMVDIKSPLASMDPAEQRDPNYRARMDRPIWAKFETRVEAETITGEDGRYVFADLVPGKVHYLRARGDGWIQQKKPNVRPGQLADFRLRRGVRIEGQVLARPSGRPVEGALIKGHMVVKQRGTSAHDHFWWDQILESDAEGRFVIEAAPVGQILFLAHSDEFVKTNLTHTAMPGRTNSLLVEMQEGATARLIVYDSLTDEPISDAKVSVTDALVPDKTSYSDEQGIADVSGLGMGANAIFTVQAQGYTATRMAKVMSEQLAWKGDSAGGEAIEVYLDPCGNAAGTILDPDGNPVAGARIFVARVTPIMRGVRGRAEMVTGPDGGFLVKNLDVGTAYHIAAHTPRYAIGVGAEFEVGPGETRDGLFVQLPRGSVLSGMVQDENGAPIANADIVIEVPQFMDVTFFGPNFDLGQSDTRIVKSGPDGRYEVPDLWSGECVARLSHPNYITLEDQRVRIGDSESQVNRDFRMLLARTITGVVTTSDGSPLDGVTVSAKMPLASQSAASGAPDSTGSFEIRPLVTGNYEVVARKEGYSSVPIEDVPADSGNLNLVLRPNGMVIGQVADSGGLPIKSFSITLAPIYGSDFSSVQRTVNEMGQTRGFREEGGRFAIENIEPGRYFARVTAQGRSEHIIPEITVRSGDAFNAGIIKLSGGATLVGFVSGTGGEPAQEVIIEATRIGGPAGITQIFPGIDPREAAVVGQTLQKLNGKGGGSGEAGEGNVTGASQNSFGRTRWTGRPNRQGRYEIKGLPAGNYRVSLRSPLYVVPEPFPVELAADAQAEASFTVEIGASVQIAVKSDTGTPVAVARANVVDALTSRRVLPPGPSPTSDRQGNLRLTGLRPGNLILTIDRSGYHQQRIELTLSEGESKSLEVTLDRVIR